MNFKTFLFIFFILSCGVKKAPVSSNELPSITEQYTEIGNDDQEKDKEQKKKKQQ